VLVRLRLGVDRVEQEIEVRKLHLPTDILRRTSSSSRRSARSRA
jgi:hypothetical protein